MIYLLPPFHKAKAKKVSKHYNLAILFILLRLQHLRCVVSSITDTKIFHSSSLEHFHSKVGAFRTKVVEVIVGDCNHIKACETR